VKIHPLHRFDLTPREASALQDRLRGKVVCCPPPPRPRLVAGADCASTADGREIVAVVVVVALPGLELVEQVTGRAPLDFPYVPGLLSFREAPALLDAFARVKSAPEAVLFDGQGIAHPRRLGLASHLGLWLRLPTVGCAKSRLIGTSRGEPGPRRGSYRTLYDRGEPLGRLVRTREGVKPLWISPGHLCDLPGAMRLTLRCGGGYRLPEPTRVADAEAARQCGRSHGAVRR
jgi:deoxyribonuclease V